MKQLLFKVALFLAYSVFAGYSAWMTATSVQLKWMSQMPIWFVFIMIFIIALFAGWCLDNVVKELKSSEPKKVRFVLNLIGFVVFWTFSFMTNVHYNVIQEFGEKNLNAQLVSCKQYLEKNSEKKVEEVEQLRDKMIKEFEDRVDTEKGKFRDELLNAYGIQGELVGFGPSAKTILKDIGNIFSESAKRYNEDFDYKIYDEKRDDVYSKFHSRADVNNIVLNQHFEPIIRDAKQKHVDVIRDFYNKQIRSIKDNKELLKKVAQYDKMLQDIESRGGKDYSEYYRFYQSMDKHLLSRVDGYKNTLLLYEKSKNGYDVFKGYTVYPSDRMFNFWNVWSDWFNGYLPISISVAGQFVWAIIVDVIAFILICLIF